MLEYIRAELALILIISLAYLLGRLVQENWETLRLTRSQSLSHNEHQQVIHSKTRDRDEHSVSPSIGRRASSKFLEELNATYDDVKTSPSKLVEAIKCLCVKNYDAASALFFKGRETGLLNCSNSSLDMFLSLCSSCIRVGSPHFIFKYFAEMDAMNISRDLVFYNSVVKILTFKKHYKINLSLHDTELNLVVPRSFEDPDSLALVKSMFSCFLYSANETKEYWRAPKFFRLIEKTGMTPTENDYCNVIRATISREDWKGAVAILARANPESCRRALQMFVDATHRRDFDCLCALVETAQYSSTIVEIFISLRRRGRLMDIVDNVVKSDSVSEAVIDAVSQCVQVVRLNDSLIERLLHKIFLLKSPKTNTIDSFNLIVARHSNPGRLLPSVISRLNENTAQSGKRLVPNQQTYIWMLKASSRSLDRILEIYQLLMDISGEGAGSVDELLLSAFLQSISSCAIPGVRAWILTKGVLDDFSSKLGIKPSVGSCQILIGILVRAACANRSDSDEYFRECLGILEGDPELIPTTELFVQAIEGAIKARNSRSVSVLFQAMADEHNNSRANSQICGLSVSATTVDLLLAFAVKANAGYIIPQLVELTLLNRLPLAVESVEKIGATPRLSEVLTKYKYHAV